MGTDKELTFEAALARLDQVVTDMETGQLTLEQSIARFEEGMKLSRFCAAQLDAIERRIEVLVRKSDGSLEWQEAAAPAPEDESSPGRAPAAP